MAEENIPQITISKCSNKSYLTSAFKIKAEVNKIKGTLRSN